MNPPRHSMPMRWRREEDEILRACVDEYTEPGCSTDWSRVATKLPFRTNKDCRKRWINRVCGSLKKGPWEADEDMALRQAVTRHGRKWTLVASEIGLRSADQCAKRWQHNLDPRLDHQRWTPKEDELLLESIDRYGREWRKIQEKHYSTRSANDLKNRSRFGILSKRIAGRASSTSGSFSLSSSSPVVTDDLSQEGASLDLSMLPEEGWECMHYPKDPLPINVGELMHPQSHDGQLMAVDDMEHTTPATSAFSWTLGAPSPPGTGSDGLDPRLYHPYYHATPTDAGESSSHMGGDLVLGCDAMDPAPDGMENADLVSLLAHRASGLENCSLDGSVCIQAKGCDREILNYVLDVMLPIRHLVKMEINM